MIIDDALLARLEKLSYLNIPNEKRADVIKDLEEFVEFANNLNELDTSSVDEQFSLLDCATPMRTDHVRNDDTTVTSILSHAPRHDENFFIVPKIIE